MAIYFDWVYYCNSYTDTYFINSEQIALKHLLKIGLEQKRKYTKSIYDNIPYNSDKKINILDYINFDYDVYKKKHFIQSNDNIDILNHYIKYQYHLNEFDINLLNFDPYIYSDIYINSCDNLNTIYDNFFQFKNINIIHSINIWNKLIYNNNKIINKSIDKLYNYIFKPDIKINVLTFLFNKNKSITNLQYNISNQSHKNIRHIIFQKNNDLLNLNIKNTINIDTNSEFNTNKFINNINDGFILFMNTNESFINTYSLDIITHYINNDNDIIIFRNYHIDKQYDNKINKLDLSTCNIVFHYKNFNLFYKYYNNEITFDNLLLKQNYIHCVYIDEILIKYNNESINNIHDKYTEQSNKTPIDIKQTTNKTPIDIKQTTNKTPIDIKQTTNQIPIDIKQTTNQIPIDIKQTTNQKLNTKYTIKQLKQILLLNNIDIDTNNKQELFNKYLKIIDNKQPLYITKNIDKYTVIKLKQLLKQNKLSTTGKKSELINRISKLYYFLY